MDSEAFPERVKEIEGLLTTLENFSEPSVNVIRYEIGHSQLTLGIDPTQYRGQDSFFLHFEMVYYFEGPLGWKGANFRLGAKEEQREVRQKFWPVPQEESGNDEYEEFLDEHLCLFVLEKPTYQVKILGCTCHRLSQIPLLNVQSEYFSQLWSWGYEVYEVAKSVESLCKLRLVDEPQDLPRLVTAQQKLLGQLGTLLKRGRWLFPNITATEGEEEQKLTFLGFKQELMNTVATVYWHTNHLYLGDINLNEPVRKDILTLKQIIKKEMDQFDFWDDGDKASAEYWRIMKG